MKTKDILLKLINNLDEFEKNSTEITFANFLNYLNQKHTIEPIQFSRFDHEMVVDEVEAFKDENTSIEVSILISLMYKYAKNYIKKALEHSIINTPDEFSFLITMIASKGMTKTTLINKLVTEKTSGVETIKRLVSKNLLEEYKIDGDKKGVYVRISDFGRQNLFAALPQMNKVSKIITGNLTEKEVASLTSLLVKLDDFHNDIYFDNKLTTIDDIFESKMMN
jgi:DNA-binding MarR family transcriptional regulator